MRRTLLSLAWLLGAIFLACTVRAEEVSLPPPGAPPWTPLHFPKIERHTRYTTVRINGREALRAEADCSASALYAPVEWDLRRTPLLQWSWKLEQPLAPHDERSKSGDDFAARVYIMFRFDPARASWWQRARHRLATTLYGDVIPSTAINYVWSSREPKGTTWDNPFAAEAKMISMGFGAMPEWRSEMVDVAADYEALFGQPPTPILAIAVMTDADNTCGLASAYFGDFRLLSERPAAASPLGPTFPGGRTVNGD